MAPRRLDDQKQQDRSHDKVRGRGASGAQRERDTVRIGIDQDCDREYRKRRIDDKEEIPLRGTQLLFVSFFHRREKQDDQDRHQVNRPVAERFELPCVRRDEMKERQADGKRDDKIRQKSVRLQDSPKSLVFL